MGYQNVFDDSGIVVIREAVLEATLEDLGRLWFKEEVDVNAIDSIMVFSRLITGHTRDSPESLHTVLSRFLELQRETLAEVERSGSPFPASMRLELIGTINRVQIALAQIERSQIHDVQ
jgi:hypothetical protein